MIQRPPVFSPPPLIFRTAGSPQYGFKREFGDDLRQVTPLGLYVTTVHGVRAVADGHKGKHRNPGLPASSRRSRPEALGSPTGYVVRPGRGLLWPHPSHSSPFDVLFPSSAEDFGGEWVPTLSCVSVRACHPLYPGGPVGCRLLLPRPHWSSPSSQRLDIHCPTQVGFRVGCLTRLNWVRLRYGLHDGSPCTNKDFYNRAFAGRVASSRRRS